MPDTNWHVSSAVVSVAHGAMDSVLRLIRELSGVEVHGHDTGRIVVTIEGNSTGQLGDQLIRISLMPGVLAANMVFEHAEETEELT